MESKQLERSVDSIKSIIDVLVAEIESLEDNLQQANEEISRLNDIIDDLN